MRLSPDEIVFFESGFIKLNATIVFTWVLMIVLVVGSKLITRKITPSEARSRWQNLLEVVVTMLEQQVQEVGVANARHYLPFLGTLFIFIAAAALATIIPYFEPPTGSLSTTLGLALCVLIAVPFFGIEERGLKGYLKTYIEPTVVMLPFNIIGDFSRTLALSVRLFGNMMSGSMILAILLTVVPFVFPVIMSLMGLLTGMVQAYIFTILAAVYLAAATQATKPKSSVEKGK